VYLSLSDMPNGKLIFVFDREADSLLNFPKE